MKTVWKYPAALALASITTPSFAGSGLVVQPVQIGRETIRYDQGVPTLDLRLARGAVQIQPRGFDHGSLAFNVAIYNDGPLPATVDVTNFSLAAGDQRLAVFTHDELVGKAKKRAFWTQMAIAAVSGLAAGIASTQTTTYRTKHVSRHGVSRDYVIAPSAAGQFQASLISAGGAASVYQVQQRLDRTRAQLGDEVVQMTTINPGESYAGYIVVDKIKAKALPQRVQLMVHWNNEAYNFAFQIAPDGTPAPAFTNLTPAEPPRAPRSLPAGMVVAAPVAPRPPVTRALATASGSAPYKPTLIASRARPAPASARSMVDPSLEISVSN
ncbi:MAG: hypothetical protein QHC40_07815 [Sphingobium sp.]|nr:hypothetical protein [Sphingobium sp.]